MILVNGWTPSGLLRFEMRDGEKVLRQCWVRMEGERIAEWRDVPLHAEEASTDLKCKHDDGEGLCTRSPRAG